MPSDIRPFDVVSLVAILLGPILAILVSRYLDKLKAIRSLKENLFRILMANRGTRLRKEAVEAVNLIEVAFHGNATKDKLVRDSWDALRAHLNSNPALPTPEIWGATLDEKYSDMIFCISNALGYNINRTVIGKEGYTPIRHVDIDSYTMTIYERLTKLLTGEGHICVKTYSGLDETEDK
jgi:energy-converting hydrogenase Eha subunit C